MLEIGIACDSELEHKGVGQLVVLILGADGGIEEKITRESIRSLWPDWSIVPVQKGQIEQLGIAVQSVSGPLCLTIRAGSLLLPAFREELEEWEQRLSLHPYAWVQLLPLVDKQLTLAKFRPGESGPVLWNAEILRQEHVVDKESLPFEHYLEYGWMSRLRMKLPGLEVGSASWEPARRKMHSWQRRLEEWQLISPMFDKNKLEKQPDAGYPKLSILLSVYNDAAYLHWAIRSVWCQTSGTWELIMVDDGSTDTSLEIMEEWSALDGERIRYIKHPVNLGKGAALNTALQLAVGEWVMELDADDWLAAECVEQLSEAVISLPNSAALVYGDYGEWLEQKRGQLLYTGTRRFTSPLHIQKMLLEGAPLAPRLLRTSSLRTIGGWKTDDPTGGRLYEDMLTIARMAANYDTAHVPGLLYHRRLRRTSITRRHDSQYEQWCKWALAHDDLRSSF